MSRFQDLLQSGKPVLVDFSAEWCGPCKTMAPMLKEAKDQMGDAVTVIKVDVDRNPEAAGHYDIRSVPTLMLFKNGEVLWRQSGVVPVQTLVATVREKAGV
jgi:thioredoxin 1